MICDNCGEYITIENEYRTCIWCESEMCDTCWEGPHSLCDHCLEESIKPPNVRAEWPKVRSSD